MLRSVRCPWQNDPRSRAAAIRAERDAALEVKALTKRFPGVLALDDVSLDAAARRGPRTGRPERRRQVHAHQHSVGHAMRPTPARSRLAALPVEYPQHRVTRSSLGIATVYQELSLLPQPDGRAEPGAGARAAALRAARHRAPCATPASAALAAARPRHRSRHARSSSLSLAAAADGGDRQGARRPIPRCSSSTSRRRRSARTRPSSCSTRSALLKGQGVAILYVSHRFAEVLDLCDRPPCCATAECVATTDLQGWSEARLTEAMIGRQSRSSIATSERAAGDDADRRRAASAGGSACATSSFSVRRGEIVGADRAARRRAERGRTADRRRPARRRRRDRRSPARAAHLALRTRRSRPASAC